MKRLAKLWKSKGRLFAFLLVSLLILCSITTYASFLISGNWIINNAYVPNINSITKQMTSSDKIEQLPAYYLYDNVVHFVYYNGESSENASDISDRGFYGQYKRSLSSVLTSDEDYTIYKDSKDKSKLTFVDNITIKNIGGCIGNLLRSIPLAAYRAIAVLKYMDISTVLAEMTDGITNSAIEIVLYKDGEMSVFLALFLILWIIGVLALGVKYLKGNGVSFIEVVKEFGWLLIAAIAFGFCIHSQSYQLVQTTFTQFTSNLFEQKDVDGSGNHNMFRANYGTSSTAVIKANIDNDYGFVVQSSIEDSLVTIFGVDKINDLNFSNGSKNIDTTNSLVTCYDTNDGSTKDYDSSVFKVWSAGNSRKNIGYMYYASSSVAKINKAANSRLIENGIVETSKSGKPNKICMFIPDILSGEYKAGDETAKTIMNNLVNFQELRYFFSSLLFAALLISYIIFMFFVLYLFIGGRIIIGIGTIAMVPIPAFALYNKTRPYVKDICLFYLGGTVRLAFGYVIAEISKQVFSYLVSKGEMTKILGVVIFLLLAKLMPEQIIPKIEQLISRIEGGSALSRSISSKFGKLYSKSGRRDMANKLSQIPFAKTVGYAGGVVGKAAGKVTKAAWDGSKLGQKVNSTVDGAKKMSQRTNELISKELPDAVASVINKAQANTQQKMSDLGNSLSGTPAGQAISKITHPFASLMTRNDDYDEEIAKNAEEEFEQKVLEEYMNGDGLSEEEKDSLEEISGTDFYKKYEDFDENKKKDLENIDKYLERQNERLKELDIESDEYKKTKSDIDEVTKQRKQVEAATKEQIRENAARLGVISKENNEILMKKEDNERVFEEAKQLNKRKKSGEKLSAQDEAKLKSSMDNVKDKFQKSYNNDGAGSAASKAINECEEKFIDNIRGDAKYSNTSKQIEAKKKEIKAKEKEISRAGRSATIAERTAIRDLDTAITKLETERNKYKNASIQQIANNNTHKFGNAIRNIQTGKVNGVENINSRREGVQNFKININKGK